MAEPDRICAVYDERDAAGKRQLYAWHRAEIQQQDSVRNRLLSSLLVDTVGYDLSSLKILDVGCGTGCFLRTLVGWGANPQNLVGTEFLASRLEVARIRSAPGITWHLGNLDFAAGDSFHLVTANTVFSSILDEAGRVELANSMWRLVKPGGWVMVFDFRYNNPNNSNVRRVTRMDMEKYLPSPTVRYKTLLLAPPLARRITPISYLLSEIIAECLPLVRSHFVYMAQKD